MKLAVVGTGYVGLVTGTCFAETGNHVICVDIDAKKVERMRNGEIPIYEPGLETIFSRNIEQGNLTFTTDLQFAVDNSEVIFLALPTPPNEDGSADLQYVLQVSEQLGKLIKEYKIIIDKSTVPVGTAEKVRDVIAKNCTVDFDVVSNPEFLREGVAVEDFMKPERVVIGTESERAKEVLNRLYAPFVRQGNPVIFMDERSAELTKYAANAFLATKITFMNEIANLCEIVGADVDMVRKGIGSDSRIGKRFLFPGVGYGGSCFPKDVKALNHIANENDYDFHVLKSVIEVNDKQRTILVEKIKNKFGNKLSGKNIAIWGLAFKPNTDDIREAPAIYIIDALLKLGATIHAFDPEAMDNVRKIYGDKIQFAQNAYDVLQDADALVIITEWNVFRSPDFDMMRSMMRQHIIFDGRNVFDLQEIKSQGFYYESIGRKVVE
ncbi:MAG: UDP-glucose/GDP-mannose dehydrogenase family protein [Bacteroidetes bacterium]|nr:UDP-glucose/GDP-mannose dehydrogenase family protein [Bacteroidota bacterium]MBP7399202.1 UDP-glucose/GDP-mannose dehydrogenase family protein [Chitinophagales bacterium]MBK7108122.1 UDP-glucose/GDP-mannose dehydrogenase family protein [Bacteroidota bacterium]MBK8486444.1 UDP-glucose/GDP-mannose dehydrogenase family protein [Bacteroidota bacterium]MBK8683224.1 UDP-glucose/GDP-mannose dehydrogenase family protein [Bacteroidota bacterium]